jgi:MoxR-like ATPase
MATSPGAEAVYEAVRLFRQSCIDEDSSLLWPDMPLWTRENLDALWNKVAGQLLPDIPHKKDTLSRALEGASEDLSRMSADLVALARLYPTMHSAHKRSEITDVFNKDSIDAPSNQVMGLVWTGLRGSIPGGKNYHRGTLFADVAFYLRFAQKAKSERVDLANAQRLRAFVDEIMHDAELSSNGQRVWTQPRHALLHLFFPDMFVGVVNKQHRVWILNQFSDAADVPSGSDDDSALNMIRQHLSNEYVVEPFDFYDDAIQPLWFRGKAARTSATQQIESEEDELMLSQDDSMYQPLMDATHLSSDFLEEIDELLQEKRQLIFEGPPGSGKTFVADKFARWFTGQSLNSDTVNDQVEIVQFHQSYGYEDFVQGIRPKTNEAGQLIYTVEKGIFLEMCERAIAKEDRPYVLIIDEINRGNLSRIFGELLLLLEYRDKSVRLPYDNSYMRIPKNLYIIGTMNTADRSLAQIDHALRRRFYFLRFMPVVRRKARVFENWLIQQDRLTSTDRSRLLNAFITLNEGISTKLDSEDLQVGHSYFMTDDIETESGFNRVWVRAVAPLLNEYLHHHRNRVDILDELTPANLVRGAVEESIQDADENAEALDRELV